MAAKQSEYFSKVFQHQGFTAFFAGKVPIPVKSAGRCAVWVCPSASSDLFSIGRPTGGGECLHEVGHSELVPGGNDQSARQRAGLFQRPAMDEFSRAILPAELAVIGAPGLLAGSRRRLLATLSELAAKNPGLTFDPLKLILLKMLNTVSLVVLLVVAVVSGAVGSC